MKRIKKIFYSTFLLSILCLFMGNEQVVFASSEDQSEVVETYSIQMDTEELQDGIAVYALDTNNITVQSNERVSYFDCSTYGNVQRPQITASIKYILQDGTNGDTRGTDGNYRKRYVYCLSHDKESPIGQTLSQSGWCDSAVYYVMDQGAVYYGELCRNSSYTTGNWQWDYLATHFAIVVITGQYTLDSVKVSIGNSGVPDDHKQKLISAISNMVEDALSEKAKKGIDGEGWFCIDQSNGAAFSLKRINSAFTYQDGKYFSDWIYPYFTTGNDYYANEKIIAFSHENIPEEVIVETKYTDCIHSPYRLVVSEDTYKQWQRTGKSFTIGASVAVPAYWRLAQFVPEIDQNRYQNVALPIYSVQKENKNFTAEITFDIPKSYDDMKLPETGSTAMVYLLSTGLFLMIPMMRKKKNKESV